MTVHDDAERGLHIVEIIQRLAHPHHHDVGQQAPVGGVVAAGRIVVVITIVEIGVVGGGIAGSIR